MDKVLIVEDDAEIAMLERDYLEISGFKTHTVSNGIDAADEAINGDYSLILLDLMLPGKSGEEICREIRDIVDVPILMVTAKTESMDKIRGLVMGADDYISKPFDPTELVARVRSHINRYKRLTSMGICSKSIKIKGLTIDTENRRVFKNGTEANLTECEFELLLFLMQNPNTVFSKEELFEKIQSLTDDITSVASCIDEIRKKTEDDPTNPKFTETVWGAGYRFNM